MASGGRVQISRIEFDLIRRLNYDDLVLLLTDIEDQGWMIARERLSFLARRPEYRVLPPSWNGT